MFFKNILNPFLKTIEKYGDRTAFCINEKFYSYNEFAKCISKIQKALQTSDPKIKNIGIVANDDIETYAAIFAVWFEGFAYIPLHPKQPIDRNIEIISQANIDLVLDSSDKKVIPNILTIESKDLSFDAFILQPKPIGDNILAYILFTSGSTGKPKGVPILRKNIASFIKSFCEIGFQINENDRCLQCFDLTFDVSIQSFLIPLLKGACIYTIPHNQIKYSYIYGLLTEHKLSLSIMTPSMLRCISPYFSELNIESMRYCFLTAEASPIDLVNEWVNCIPNAEIYNFYGPTEATIYCTYYKYNRDKINKCLNGILSIGKAMNGLNVIIRDENGNVLGTGGKGELCISGDQLTPGYWNDQLKTNQSFFETEHDGVFQRFYKTGDCCFLDSDEDIMFIGRLDNQVKIQGYRIELGEIEYYAREFIKGQNVVALTYENKKGNTQIALFVEGELYNRDSLIDYLHLKLPFYMIPSKVIINEKFPLNISGKIDHLKLKNLASS